MKKKFFNNSIYIRIKWKKAFIFDKKIAKNNWSNSKFFIVNFAQYTNFKKEQKENEFDLRKKKEKSICAINFIPLFMLFNCWVLILSSKSTLG